MVEDRPIISVKYSPSSSLLLLAKTSAIAKHLVKDHMAEIAQNAPFQTPKAKNCSEHRILYGAWFDVN